ncbi:MAG: hypothetical protein K2Y12_04900 [Chitinophagaceae bacterium]|nr:hypothetical protein [Chitinophagaceae bacterium]
MRFSIGLFIACMYCSTLLSCKEGKEQQTKADTVSFFSLKELIMGDVKDAVQTPYLLVAYTINDKQKDSIIIDTTDLKIWANRFLQKDFNDPEWKPKFNEAVFNDQTTQTYTLSYTTKDDNIPLKQADITAEENSNKVKRIFVRHQWLSGDTVYFTNGVWKPGKSFWISTTKKFQDSIRQTTINYIKWNDKGPLPLLNNDR